MGLSMSERKAVTKAMATRYARGTRAEKGAILDELCALTVGLAVMPAALLPLSSSAEPSDNRAT